MSKHRFAVTGQMLASNILQGGKKVKDHGIGDYLHVKDLPGFAPSHRSGVLRKNLEGLNPTQGDQRLSPLSSHSNQIDFPAESLCLQLLRELVQYLEGFEFFPLGAGRRCSRRLRIAE